MKCHQTTNVTSGQWNIKAKPSIIEGIGHLPDVIFQ